VHEFNSSTTTSNGEQMPIKFEVECNYLKKTQLKSDESPGPDGMHPLLLNRCAEVVVEPLFQKSFNSGQVPTDWKIANVRGTYLQQRNQN